MRTKAPPMAIPTIAPVDNFGDPVFGGAEVGFGIARVGDRTATDAFCAK